MGSALVNLQLIAANRLPDNPALCGGRNAG